MKKTGLMIGCAIFFVALLAQDKIYIHKTDKSIVDIFVSVIDSIVFANADTELNVYKTDNTISNFTLSDIDSILFAATSDTVFLSYSEGAVSIINPLSAEGVQVIANGADVTVNSTVSGTEVKYSISGSSGNGSLKIYSTNKFGLILNGISLSNTDGPAINVQSSKKVSVTLVSGKSNALTDGSTYTSSTEDQKGTFFSEGQLVFGGTGSLTVKSFTKHGICSDDYIQIDNGNITVTSAGKDGIHSKDYFKMNGGTLNVTATSDGIDCEDGHVIITGGNITTINATANVKGINADSTMTISGGTIHVNMSGNQSKGLKSTQKMNLSGGDITIGTSGAAVLEVLGSGFDPSYCSAIKCDTTITLNGANIIITSTGMAGKGISGDADINISSGNITISTTGSGTTYVNSNGIKDSYAATCIKADGNLNIAGGNITTTSSGNGGKGFSADGSITLGDANNSPTINLKTTGSRFLVSGTDYCHPKTLVATGAVIINNGINTFSSTDDGIHSAASITINGGANTISAMSSIQGVGEGVEAPIITFNGGTTNITASNDGINATYGTVSGGTESNDGSNLYIKGGTVIVAGSDAIDSNGNITISGGITIVNGPSTGVEEGIDFNGSLIVNGGLLISAGSNSNMSKAMSSTSTQPGMFIKSGSLISSSSLLHVENASGKDLVTFKPKNGGYYFLFSSSSLVKGTQCKIYSGGSYTGGSFVGGTTGYGLYTGGAFSTTGATLKSTTTLSSSATVNTITF